MEKIKNPIHKKLPPLVLYLDDIQELCEFLKVIAKRPVIIETCNYKLNTLEELSKLKEEKTNSITFKCDEPFFSIELHKSGGFIFISKTKIEDVEAEGIVASIEKILLPHRKSFVFSTVSNSYLGSLLLGASTTQLVIGKIGKSNNLILYLFALALFIISVFWTILGFRLSIKRYNTVFLKLRKESASFWKRNKDQIIVGVVTAVITAIVSSFVTVLITAKVSTKTSSFSEPNSQKEIVQQDVNSH